MSPRARTHDCIPLDLVQPRARRDTRATPIKPGTVFGAIATLIALGTLVWGMATLVQSKADKESVHKIQTDVEVIKTRQEIFIEAVRPGLVPKER